MVSVEDAEPASYQHKDFGKHQTAHFIKYFDKLLLYWRRKHTSH